MIFLTAILLGLMAPPQDKLEARYLDGLSDMPLPAYVQLVDDPLIYDVPSGMIVRAEFLAAKSHKLVRRDMTTLLVEHGWDCGAVAVANTQKKFACELEGRRMIVDLSRQQGQRDSMQTAVILRVKPADQ